MGDLRETKKFWTYEKKIFLYALVVSVAVLAVCSKCSFLYPINDGYDANCFFTVGKAVANGKVMYTDIYEQKGPLLYFIHTLAYWMSNDTFIGIYWIECILFAIFLYYSYKIVSLYAPKAAFVVIPILAVGIASSNCFGSGDNAEEFCLPLIAYSLYRTICHYKNNESYSKGFLLLSGLFAGCMFWIKFTMTGFYLAWILLTFFDEIIHKHVKKAFVYAGIFATGCLLATLPYVIYFAVNHSLWDWFEVYIYNNIFLYSNTSGGLWKPVYMILRGVALLVIRNLQFSPFLVIGLLWALFTKKEKGIVKASILILFAVSAIGVFCGGVAYFYYGLILAPFVVFGFIPLLCLLEQHVGAVKKLCGRAAKYVAAGLMVACVALSYALSENTYLMHYQKEELPHYQFKEIIGQTENPTLLNYGHLDWGFYTVCNIVPNARYFCNLNIQVPGLAEEWQTQIDNGDFDYIVARDPDLGFPQYEKGLLKAVFKTISGKSSFISIKM